MSNLPDWWPHPKPYAIMDCIKGLQGLPDNVIQCVVTSPLYWGLRDYGTATWEGGDEGCDHTPPYGSGSSTLGGGKSTQESAKLYRNICGKCGARRVDKQLGLEQTPEEYVQKIVEVFHEVKRVLREDGTLWLNLGDSYAGGLTTTGGYSNKSTLQGYSSENTKGRRMNMSENPIHRLHGLKPKDLVGIPWRVAFALQADGWYLRSDII